MLRFFSVIFSLLFSFAINGQGVLSSELQAVIAVANPNDFISIRIEFKENVVLTVADAATEPIPDAPAVAVAHAPAEPGADAAAQRGSVILETGIAPN